MSTLLCIGILQKLYFFFSVFLTTCLHTMLFMTVFCRKTFTSFVHLPLNRGLKDSEVLYIKNCDLMIYLADCHQATHSEDLRILMSHTIYQSKGKKIHTAPQFLTFSCVNFLNLGSYFIRCFMNSYLLLLPVCRSPCARSHVHVGIAQHQ